MKILMILNYYTPYVSGVTEYARLAAEMLVREGHEVIVLASNHAGLPPLEIINGVQVVRSRVLLRISKGVVSMEFLRFARKLIKHADKVVLHLPMLESGCIAQMVPTEKLVVTYQCDVNLPNSALNNFITGTMDVSHDMCLRKAKTITVTSIDYAEHSRVAGKYRDKLVEVGAPIKEYQPVPTDSNDHFVIGFCGRIVEEKGIDVLVKAFAIVKQELPDAVLEIAGDYTNVAGGSVYPQLKEYIDQSGIEDITFLGMLPEDEMPAFFSRLDVFVLPSVNSLEAFGMVQIEAMKCGTPVVSSDLYGVRTIVQRTGAGVVTRAGDEQSLADGILEVAKNRTEYVKKLEYLDEYYSNKLWASSYTDALMG